MKTAIAFLISLIAAASVAPAGSVPPPPEHYVTDHAGLLDRTYPMLSERLERQLHEAINSGNKAVCVWIGATTGGEDAATWSDGALRSWNASEVHRCDIVLFVFANDRTVRIETDPSARDALSDTEAQTIVARDFEPLARQNRLAYAVHTTVNDILATTAKSTSKSPSTFASPMMYLGWWTILPIAFVAIFLFFIGFVIWFAFSMRDKRGSHSADGQLAMLAHWGVLLTLQFMPFLNWIVPVIVLAAKGKTSPFVAAHAKASANAQLTLSLCQAGALIAILVLALVVRAAGSHSAVAPVVLAVMIVVCLVPVGCLIVQLVSMILAVVAARAGRLYRYPLAIAFFR